MDIDYDGAGNDVFNMADGRIVDNALLDTPEFLLDNTTSPEYVDIGGELDPSSDFIELLSGNDTVNMTGGELGTELDPVSIALGDQATSGLGNDADVFNQSGGIVWGGVFGLGGGNTYNLSGDAVINGQLFTGSQDDTVSITGDALIVGENDFDFPTAVGLEDGDDVFTMTSGTIEGNIDAGEGNDSISMSGGEIELWISGLAGNDTISISGDAVVGSGTPPTGFFLGIFSDDGDDLITIASGTVRGNVGSFDGDDTIVISGGVVDGVVIGGSGTDTITLSGGQINGSVFGGIVGDIGGDDTITVSGSIISGDVGGNAGNDIITFTDGTIGGNVNGGDYDDTVTVSGGAIGGDIIGGTGVDQVTVSAGTIEGDIAAESVTIAGGTIGGDILGLSGNTLVIDDSQSAAPISLRDGVVFRAPTRSARSTIPTSPAARRCSRTAISASRPRDRGLATSMSTDRRSTSSTMIRTTCCASRT